ncbi:MAG TPA: hypothetical protein VGH73_03165 [Thermoanaerobaculia bacterium]
MRKVLFLLSLMILAASASRAAAVHVIDPNLYDMVNLYAADVGEQPIVVGPMEKAVPRTDKAEAQIIGAVLQVDDVHFTADGTPFRIIALAQSRPVSQFILVVCLGDTAANTCGRLTLGKRVYFTTDLLVVQTGTNAGFPLLIAKRLQV